MNKILHILTALFAGIVLVTASAPLYAQEEAPQGISDTLGSALSFEFDQDYDIVFKQVKQALADLGYEVSYASSKRKLVETSFKQLADGDNFYDVMEIYGEIPYMRSPGWTTGRVKVTVSFEALGETKTAVKVLAQLSGFEERFTNVWHYWSSNGRIEQEVMGAISSKIEAGDGSGTTVRQP